MPCLAQVEILAARAREPGKKRTYLDLSFTLKDVDVGQLVSKAGLKLPFPVGGRGSLQVKASVYSIEAANPRHQHEWRVWQEVKLPEGKSLMPGVIGHATDIIEHPRMIADRLIQYAELVGKHNVIAGTDCGVGSRVWNGEIAWAKFEAMAEGARIASQELWAG